MRHLWHTLYLTQPNTKLHLEGEALKVVHDDGRVDHVPLHLLESIVTFSYGTVSQNVMDACASRGIGLYFHSPNGRLRFQIQAMSIFGKSSTCWGKKNGFSWLLKCCGENYAIA